MKSNQTCHRPTRREILAGAAATLALLATGQFAPPFVNAAHAQAAGVAQSIADHFASVRTMMGEFVQFGPSGEQTGGKFYIERPGKVRFKYESPANFEVVSDGQTVVLENTKLRTADVYPLSKTPLKLLLDSSIDLSGDKVRSVKEEADATTIQLADKSVFGDSTITMMFDPKSYELKQWTITDAQGRDTTVMIFNVEKGVTFDPSVFTIDHQRINSMKQTKRDR